MHDVLEIPPGCQEVNSSHQFIALTIFGYSLVWHLPLYERVWLRQTSYRQHTEGCRHHIIVRGGHLASCLCCISGSSVAICFNSCTCSALTCTNSLLLSSVLVMIITQRDRVPGYIEHRPVGSLRLQSDCNSVSP